MPEKADTLAALPGDSTGREKGRVQKDETVTVLYYLARIMQTLAM